MKIVKLLAKAKAYPIITDSTQTHPKKIEKLYLQQAAKVIFGTFS